MNEKLMEGRLVKGSHSGREIRAGWVGGGGGGGGGGGPLDIGQRQVYTSIEHVRLNCMLLFSHNTIQFWTAGPLLYLEARDR